MMILRKKEIKYSLQSVDAFAIVNTLSAPCCFLVLYDVLRNMSREFFFLFFSFSEWFQWLTKALPVTFLFSSLSFCSKCLWKSNLYIFSPAIERTKSHVQTFAFCLSTPISNSLQIQRLQAKHYTYNTESSCIEKGNWNGNEGGMALIFAIWKNDDKIQIQNLEERAAACIKYQHTSFTETHPLLK